MVSARILRRREAARFEAIGGGADRFNCAVMGGDFRCGKSRTDRRSLALTRRATRPRNRTDDPALHAALRSDAADVGYIKGYPPGVRENGGQYTHAAAWVAMAFARQGDGDKAVRLLRMLNP